MVNYDCVKITDIHWGRWRDVTFDWLKLEQVYSKPKMNLKQQTASLIQRLLSVSCVVY